jgi:hypothetical protein
MFSDKASAAEKQQVFLELENAAHRVLDVWFCDRIKSHFEKIISEDGK